MVKGVQGGQRNKSYRKNKAYGDCKWSIGYFRGQNRPILIIGGLGLVSSFVNNVSIGVQKKLSKNLSNFFINICTCNRNEHKYWLITWL